jgi:hypothetical protein
MGRYLDLAWRASQGRAGVLTYERNEINEERGDAYAKRLRALMQPIRSPDYPGGMIPWLDDACPILYTELTERLPKEMQRLWEARAPLDEFERVVDLWMEALQTACKMYEQHLAGGNPQRDRMDRGNHS